MAGFFMSSKGGGEFVARGAEQSQRIVELDVAGQLVVAPDEIVAGLGIVLSWYSAQATLMPANSLYSICRSGLKWVAVVAVAPQAGTSRINGPCQRIGQLSGGTTTSASPVSSRVGVFTVEPMARGLARSAGRRPASTVAR